MVWGTKGWGAKVTSVRVPSAGCWVVSHEWYERELPELSSIKKSRDSHDVRSTRLGMVACTFVVIERSRRVQHAEPASVDSFRLRILGRPWKI